MASESLGCCTIVKGKIGIATVLYNSGEVLAEFLASLRSQTYTNFVVYVVDNASVDNSAEQCSLAGDRFIVTINKRNTGFAYGTNQGIRQALEDGCEYVLLLNNDVAFEADFLDRFVKGMERTAADIGAPLTFYYDRPNIIWAAGGRFQRWAGYRPLHLGMEQQYSAEFAQDRLIQFSPGSGLMAHRRVFERIGFLDETFFTYWEDTDFSVRALKAGLRSYLIPKARLWHKVSSLTGMNSEFQRFYAVRNHALYIAKHCGPLEATLLHGIYLTAYRLIGLLRLRTDERVAFWKKGIEIARTAGYK
ncbi:hypothetical protein SAMN05421819_2540 [Bryocella elongata]|uniref:Glycosyltransferase 2-like domain-containing protein n=1 Tax=Bryocella elongata TaxID=863522 RepID=A0A1H5ZBU6_9BACT|nr:glycosyltransferase family 2 protein [Bryocella elongata]SEG33127.1 hypothetical protein SAMN05421819_2540 [Bryocella elongata]